MWGSLQPGAEGGAAAGRAGARGQIAGARVVRPVRIRVTVASGVPVATSAVTGRWCLDHSIGCSHLHVGRCLGWSVRTNLGKPRRRRGGRARARSGRRVGVVVELAPRRGREEAAVPRGGAGIWRGGRRRGAHRRGRWQRERAQVSSSCTATTGATAAGTQPRLLRVMMVALAGQVVLLLSVMLLMVKVMVLLMVRVGGRRGRFTGGRVREGPDLRLGGGYRHPGRATVGLYALVLEVLVPRVALVMVVVVLHRVVKRVLSPPRILLEIEVVLVVEVLVVLQVLRLHVPHRLCKQTVTRQFTTLPSGQRSGSR